MHIRSIPYVDPLAAFQIFARQPRAILLDSAASHNGKAGISYIAADPFSHFESRSDGARVDGKKIALDPFTLLERELEKYIAEKIDAPVPFIGGAAGFLGYELGGFLERLPEPRRGGPSLPTMAIGLYDTVAAFDHDARAAWIMSHGWPETLSGARASRARQRAEFFAQKIEQAPKLLPAPNWQPRGAWQAELARDHIEKCIARVIDYIKAGDIFQANFTQRFSSVRPQALDDFMIYRRLRALNPAPFAAFLRGDGYSILSASPERFLQLRPGGVAEAYPIKGTRPRAADTIQDGALARELQRSAKDRAENLMIVDLMRNDLSRVCRPGSVQVPQLCALESFATVHHLVSRVAGQLKAGMGPVDLLRASFPGGSVTGAPKIRAMEIIHELESAPRGAYCGCLGWIGFDRTMDMSMTIRTMTIAGDKILAQAGGGIVADSNPSDEYEESMIKITPLLRALSGGDP